MTCFWSRWAMVVARNKWYSSSPTSNIQDTTRERRSHGQLHHAGAHRVSGNLFAGRPLVRPIRTASERHGVHGYRGHRWCCGGPSDRRLDLRGATVPLRARRVFLACRRCHPEYLADHRCRPRVQPVLPLHRPLEEGFPERQAALARRRI